jgi:hypothetical protein
MAKKQKVVRVFETAEEAQKVATERGERAWLVSGAYVVSGSRPGAIYHAIAAKVVEVEAVELDKLPSFEQALATLANASPEQRAQVSKMLKGK